MDNIPNGYDENGVRAGNGSWDNYECPECGSNEVFFNGSDELICDNCGYEEGEDDTFESEEIDQKGEEITARYKDKETGKWSDWKTVMVFDEETD